MRRKSTKNLSEAVPEDSSKAVETEDDGIDFSVVLQAIAGLDDRLRDVLDEIRDMDPAPVLDIVRRLDARPDPDQSSIVQAFEKSELMMEERLTHVAETA